MAGFSLSDEDVRVVRMWRKLLESMLRRRRRARKQEAKR